MASAVVGALRMVLGMDVAQFSEGAKKAESSMDRLAKRANALGSAIGAAFIAGRLERFASESIAAFGKQEDAIAAVDAALKATGGTAGYTSDQLQAMASKLQEVSTYGDEDVLKNVTANLLTFGNIVGPVFDRAQKAALDLSARLGQDLQSSTIQLGKALNDPIKGITALQRVGVAFTSSQREQIKTLVASNKVMEAQKLILDELGKEFGGQAEAIANTTQGKLKQAANAFGDAMEAVGKVISPVILPAAQAIKTLAEEFQALDPHAKTFIVTTAAVAAGIAAATIAAGAFAAVVGTISAPFIAVGAAISAAVGIILANFQYIQEAAIKTKGAIVDFGIRVSNVFTTLRGNAEDLRRVNEELAANAIDTSNALQKLRAEYAKPNPKLPEPPKIKLPTGDDPEKAANAQRDLNKSISDGIALVKQSEGPWAKYARQQTDITNALKAHKITAEQAALTEKKLFDQANENFQGGAELVAKYTTPYEQMQQTIARLNAEYQAGAISALALGRAQEQAALIASSAYADMAGNIAGSLTQVFQKNKGVAIAAGVIDAIGASLKALAAYPPPFSYVAAAAALAAGFAKVAAIKSTNENGGGGGGAAAGGSAPSAQAAQPQQKQGVFINLQGQNFGRQQVKDLIGKINDAVADGAILKVA